MYVACICRNLLHFTRRAAASSTAPTILNSCRSFSINKTRPMKIYTKTGDSGTSAMFTGERRSKEDPVFEALGSLDELTAHIGLAADVFVDSHQTSNGSEAIGDNDVFLSRLEKIQCCLQDIASHVATAPSSEANERLLNKTKFDAELIDELESWIDEYTARLPPLKNFIIPGGSKAASSIHVARAVCRRAERRMVPLLEQNLDEVTYRYMNRLSDYFFTIARSVAHDAGKPERIYHKPKSTIHRNDPKRKD